MKGKLTIKTFITPVVWLTALAVTAGLLLSYEYYVLWKIQEQNLFLDTSLFFQQLMLVPGGLLTYIGSFLTQLLYYPVLGVAILCLLWGLLMWMMQRTFMVGRRWAPLLVVPVAMLLAANVEMGYWIYPIKLKGWYFDATIGVMVIVALLWLFRILSAHRIGRRVLLVMTTIVGYPLFGTYALAATLLMALWCWRLDKNRWQALADTMLGALIVLAAPLFYYQYVYYQTNMVNLWWTALPIFKILESYHQYYVPYALLGVCLVILTIFKWQTANEDEQNANHTETAEYKTLWVLPLQGNKGGASKQTKQPSFKKVKVKKKAVKRRNYKAWWQNAIVIGVLAATVFGVKEMWMKDENFHREAAMQYYVEQTRWEEVLVEAAKQQDVPTRSIVMMRNLALTRLGRQGSEMYRFANGSKKPDSPFAPPASMIVGDMIYYHYGMLNDCHHMCIEGGVEFGWRVQHLKYMARCGLMAGDTNVMYKYTNQLKHTLFHSQWAEHLETLQQAELRKKDKETGPVMHMMHYPDIVGTDHGYLERYLMNHLAVMDSDDPYFQEQCLLATLWTKDSSQFWPRFLKYLSQHRGEPIPRYYREAAYLYSVIEENAPIQVPVDEGMKRTFEQFDLQLQQYDDREFNEVRKALYPMFGDTYFFEYFLMEDIAYL